MTRRFAGVLALACVCGVLPASPAFAEYGLREINLAFENEDGGPATQAGSHPFALTTDFGVTTEPSATLGYEVPTGTTKDIRVALPAGFVGDATAVPSCPTAVFFERGTAGGKCASDSAVGKATTTVLEPSGAFLSPVYSLPPPPGVAAEIGFWTLIVPTTIDLTVNPNPPYNVIAYAKNIPEVAPFYHAKLTIWGDPESAVHDYERGKCVGGNKGACPVTAADKPYLTMPTSCVGPLTASFEGDTWEAPGVFASQSAQTHDRSEPSLPLGTTGCSTLDFGPTIESEPTTVSAASPTGLDFALAVHDEGITSAEGLAQSDLEKAVIKLPEAMSVNPALAEGLGSCSEADLARESVLGAPGEGCPEESKIGTVEVETPLLDHALKGSLYLASPYQNQFGSLLALYVVIKDPETGIMLKLAGKVVPDEATGQLVSVFENLPQLPFSKFRLNFRQGQRSPLVTPSACGTYTTEAELFPWSDPSRPLHDSWSFQITSGIAGGPCPASSSVPFRPTVTAGASNNSAGAYSPFDIQITRNDGEQEITGFSSLLPQGVTANLSGVPFCSDAQIATAQGKTGAEEEASPSCPVGSEIGHTLVGVGVGSVLAYTPGKLYMAGPYDGAPFSVVAITSAKVGPFDLGTVVVHLPLNIDPLTAQVSIPAGAADQIPHIVKGIVVHVRDIRVYVDRPDFTLNPTNCTPSSFGATVIGSGANFVSPADDVPSSANDPFQVANCANLQFKPTFKASTSGRTSRKAGASLTVKLAYPKAPQGTQANIKSVKVDLPKQLPSRLTTLQKACTSAQFQADPAGCPAASIVGHATAITPILPVPIEGPAYFVSYGGAKFPELVIVLQGYGVTIDLHGETFINKAGITSSTFRTVPDQPVTSFELTLPQGQYSALAASGNLCTTKLSMPTAFTAQNGATFKQATKITVTGCSKHKTKKTKSKSKFKRSAKKTDAGRGKGSPPA